MREQDSHEMSRFDWAMLIIKLVFAFPISFISVYLANVYIFPYFYTAWFHLVGDTFFFAQLNMLYYAPLLALPLATPFLIHRYKNNDLSLKFVTAYGVFAGIVFSVIVEASTYLDSPEDFEPLLIFGHALLYIFSFVLGAWVFHLMLSLDILLPFLKKRIFGNP